MQAGDNCMVISPWHPIVAYHRYGSQPQQRQVLFSNGGLHCCGSRLLLASPCCSGFHYATTSCLRPSTLHTCFWYFQLAVHINRHYVAVMAQQRYAAALLRGSTAHQTHPAGRRAPAVAVQHISSTCASFVSLALHGCAASLTRCTPAV